MAIQAACPQGSLRLKRGGPGCGRFGLPLDASGEETRELEVEILVLRHQLKVLARKAGRPKLGCTDRAFLAAASRMLTRERWASFLVSPATLLGWHRELVRRKPVDPGTRERGGISCGKGGRVSHLTVTTAPAITIAMTAQIASRFLVFSRPAIP